MIPVVSALIAAVLAALGPLILRILPEPVEPEEDKTLYVDLGRRPRLAWWLALSAGAYAAAVAYFIPEPRLLPVWILLSVVGPLLAYIDWQVHLLPYWIVAPSWLVAWALTAVSAWLLHDLAILKYALYGNLTIFVGFWVFHVVLDRFAGGGFGYGDVRFSAVIGVALGPLGLWPSFAGIFASFLIFGLVGTILQKGRLGNFVPHAFGPYMVLGAVCGVLVFQTDLQIALPF